MFLPMFWLLKPWSLQVTRLLCTPSGAWAQFQLPVGTGVGRWLACFEDVRGKGFPFHTSVFSLPKTSTCPAGEARNPQLLHPLEHDGSISVGFLTYLESQQHSPLWCPTTRFIITILYQRPFSKSGGLLPATSWLFFSCVLFYTGQCHGFLLSTVWLSDIPALEIDRQESKTPYPM